MTRLIEMLRLPTDDSGTVVSQELGTSSTALYRLLSTAEGDVFIDLAARVPWALMGAPTLQVSTDGGYTYPIKDAAGTTVSNVFGHVGVYIRKEDIPDSPLVEGRDFSLEGANIRIPNNRTWPYSDGPWCQVIPEPVALSATGSPTLPVNARWAMIANAAARFCKAGGRDWRPFDQDYAAELAKLCLMYQTAVKRQGATPWRAGTSRIGMLAPWYR